MGIGVRVQLQIREAALADCAGLARTQVDSYRMAYAGILPQAYLDRFTYEEQEQDWHDLLSSGQAGVLLVAESGSEEMVGYALARPEREDAAPYQGELVALHVRRPYQRQGIGRRLVVAAAERLRQQGCRSLVLWVLAENPARRFYERLGAQIVGQRTISLTEGEDCAVEVGYGWADIDCLCEQAAGT